MKNTFLKYIHHYPLKITKHIFLESIFSITPLLFFLTAWLTDNFGENPSIDLILRSISNKAIGEDWTSIELLKKSFIAEVITPSLILNALLFIIYYFDKIILLPFFAKIISSLKWLSKPLNALLFIKRHIITITLPLFLYAFYQFYATISGFGFLLTFFHHFNQKFESYYVKNPKISFSDQKRNLVFIFLESMENAFQNKDISTKDSTPNLTTLKKNAISTANHQTIGTHYTLGTIISAFCGQPAPSLGGKRLHRKLCLGDILNEAGYNLFFLSNAQLAGFNEFAREHHLKRKITCLEDIKKYYPNWEENNDFAKSKIPDSKLFLLGKMKIEELSKSDKPFAVTLLSVVNNSPEGFWDPDCKAEYTDMLMCVDTQISNLINWIQNQEFAKNTTIVIVRDRLFTADDKMNRFSKFNKNRENNFNVIINPAENVDIKNQITSHVDFLPTTIEALGGKIDGGRIALGTSIFSDKQPLIEEIGEDKMNSLLFYYCAKGTSNIKDKMRALSGDVEQ